MRSSDLYVESVFRECLSDTAPSPRGQRPASIESRAEAGDAKAQVQLGLAYAAGDGVAADDGEAARWFRKAAEQEDRSGEYSLGEMYLTGRGVSADTTEAAKWIRRAAEHGREVIHRGSVTLVRCLPVPASFFSPPPAKLMNRAGDAVVTETGRIE